MYNNLIVDNLYRTMVLYVSGESASIFSQCIFPADTTKSDDRESRTSKSQLTMQFGNNKNIAVLNPPSKDPSDKSWDISKSGSEYVPDSSEESDSLNHENRVKEGSASSHMPAVECVTIKKSTNMNSEFQEYDSVKVTCKDSTFPNAWDKRYHCLFCKKSFAKLPRHLETDHAEEEEVKEFMNHPKKSKARANLIELLRNKGNYLHNSDVLIKNSGDIITIRRPANEADVSDFLPCEFCFGYFSARKLSRHQKQCHHRSAVIGNRTNVKRTAILLLPKNQHASKLLCSKVLSAMQNDKFFKVIKNDELILNHGSRLCSKFSELPHLNNFIKQKLRELARFLLAVKELDGTVKNLTDCFDPSYFDTVINAVKRISGYNPKQNTFATPSLAKKIGFSLKKCAVILKAKALKKSDNKTHKKITQFMELYDMEWSNAISNCANTTLYKNKWNKDINFPKSPDLKILNSFVLKQEAELSKRVKENPIKEDWISLAKVSMSHIIIFNRRRVGEVERMTLKDFSNKRTTSTNPEIEKLLSGTEKELSQNLTIIEIRGKHGKKVPVLLSPSMKESLDLLIERRDIAQIDEKNEYIFAVPLQKSSYYRGCYVLRKIVDLAGCEKPELISSTLLRKHVATMAQLIDLKNNEKEQLASFMGHTSRTHEDFYRLPEKTIQSAKIDKILINMEQAKMDKCAGKTLDEVDVDVSRILSNNGDAEVQNVPGTSSSMPQPFAEEDSDNEHYSLRNKKNIYFLLKVQKAVKIVTMKKN